jgi:hypothetical protein
MAYTTVDNPELYFQVKTYTGNGSTQSITFDGSENMKPDIVWVKQRNSNNGGIQYDSTRGANKKLDLNSNNAQETQTDGLSSFDTDGFSTGANNAVNDGSDTYCTWNWNVGEGSTSSNSNGGITSTVQANTTAGISILQFTGSGSDATVGHGLTAAPETFWIKNISAGSSNRISFWDALGGGKFLRQDTTDTAGTDSNMFNNTAPTSSVITVGTDSATNNSGSTFNVVCVHSVQGYCKVGSYTGNGSSDGSFIFTGFKPAFIYVKNHSTGSYKWIIQDNKRNLFNPRDKYIYPNESEAEAESSNFNLDFYSNGFKPRNTRSETNDNNNKYVYLAIAESPQVNSNGVPNNAQ